jgi:hypothetical protein
VEKNLGGERGLDQGWEIPPSKSEEVSYCRRFGTKFVVRWYLICHAFAGRARYFADTIQSVNISA